MSENRITILYIENEPEIVELVRLILARRDYDILVAADGRAGLQLLEARPCDLVLLDLMMPGMDGWEVLRRIREHPVLQHIPVIILTAKAMAQDRDYGLNVAGAQAYITKPFFMHELIATIERVLATSRTSEAQKITAESAESF